MSMVNSSFPRSSSHLTCFLLDFHNLVINVIITQTIESIAVGNLHQAPVVQRLDNAIHQIKLYPVDNAIRFAITYPPDSDLSVGQRYPPLYNWAQKSSDKCSILIPIMHCSGETEHRHILRNWGSQCSENRWSPRRKMPSGRQRTSANALDTSAVTLNEKILKECHDLYTEKERGKVSAKVAECLWCRRGQVQLEFIFEETHEMMFTIFVTTVS